MRKLDFVLLLAFTVSLVGASAIEAQSNHPLVHQQQGTLLGAPQPQPPAAMAKNPSDGGGKASLNPQPFPPKNGMPSARPMKLKTGMVYAGAAVKNPRAALASSALTMQLQAQRQAAEQEASQMKLGLRPASSGAGPSRAPSTTVKMQNVPHVGTLDPGQTMSSPGAAVAASGQYNGLPVLCSQDASMRIVRVSGKATPATFTPDKQFNFYSIAGCSFGDPGPNAKVYIYRENTFHQEFQVQEWNENAIKLSLDPNLTGLLDQDNLTLVVQRADGKQAIKNGFKFYAARESKVLGKVLQQDWSLQHFTANDISKLSSQYFSPSQHGTSQGFPAGWSAAVSWNLTLAPLQTDEDVYTFRDLAPGFVADSAQAAEIDLDCDTWHLKRFGKFDLSWDDKGYLHVQWQGQSCEHQLQGVLGTKGDTFYSAGANYVLNVSVTGPRGIDPWTGKPLGGGLVSH